MKKEEFNIKTTCGTCKQPLEDHDNVHFGASCPDDFVPFQDDTQDTINIWAKWDKERKAKNFD